MPAQARIGVGLAHEREDGVGPLTTVFQTSLQGRAGVESLDHRLRVLVDLLEDVGAVEVLAAGHEPKLVLLQVDHLRISFSTNAPRAWYFS